MATYTLGTAHQSRHSDRLMIGVPLIVSTVFCFAFVLMHSPAPKEPSASKASSNDSSAVHAKTVEPLPLVSPASLTKLSSEPVVVVPRSQTAPADASPQANMPTTNELQQANSGGDTTATSVNTPAVKAKLPKKITH